MARGWESKAVEAQQAAHDTAAIAGRTALSPAEAARREREASLQLARTRVLADLQQACRPPHRAMLEAALADIDQRLADVAADAEGPRP